MVLGGLSGPRLSASSIDHRRPSQQTGLLIDLVARAAQQPHHRVQACNYFAIADAWESYLNVTDVMKSACSLTSSV